MLSEPICYKRKCLYYNGVKSNAGNEATERNVCLAFPEGIPEFVLTGENKHTKIIEGQVSNFIYVKDIKE